MLRIMLLLSVNCLIIFHSLQAKTLLVPDNYPLVQNAVLKSAEGDTILIAPGTYREQVKIKDKSITLASYLLRDGNPDYITKTILDGGGLDQAVIDIDGSGTVNLIGLTITNGDDGIYTRSRMNIINCWIHSTKDGIDFESGSGGILANCLIEHNIDDAVDMDEDVDLVIENNILADNDDDGIEIRLHPWMGHQLDIIIRNNIISRNGEDGIQFIGYNTPSNRHFTIEKNLIEGNEMAAVACMNDSNTVEDFRGASLTERVLLRDNIISGEYGIVGGDSMIVEDNFIFNCSENPLKNVDGGSILRGNILWNNKKPIEACNKDALMLNGKPNLSGRPGIKNRR